MHSYGFLDSHSCLSYNPPALSYNSATAPQNLFQFSDDNRSKMVPPIRKDALDAILKAHVAESGSSDTKDKLLGAAFVVVGYGGK